MNFSRKRIVLVILVTLVAFAMLFPPGARHRVWDNMFGSAPAIDSGAVE